MIVRGERGEGRAPRPSARNWRDGRRCTDGRRSPSAADGLRTSSRREHRARDDRQLRKSTENESVAMTPMQLVDGHGEAELRKATQQRPERKLPLHTSERRTEAEMDAVSELDVADL